MTGSCKQCHNHPCACDAKPVDHVPETGKKVDPHALHKNGKDWENHPIKDSEKLDDLIWIWQIEPATDGEGGGVWIRGYSDAIKYIASAIEHSAESCSPDDLKNGLVVSASMRLVQVSLRSYEELEKM